MAYERIFEKPYPDGYEDLPLETTPVTAQTLNDKDDALEHIEDYLETVIEANPTLQGGETNLTALKVEGTIYKIAGGGGGGGTAENITYDNTETGMTADNVQDAIDEVFQSVSSGKGLIADAITDKGIPTSASDTFATMATNIGQISGGGGSDISVDTVFNPLTGTNTYTITEAGRYLVAVGCCHNGQASITLPAGRVPIINETNEFVISGVVRKITINIVDLEVGDVVSTANAYAGQWTGSFAVISKLSGFDNVTFLSKSKVDDAQTTLTVPSDSNTYGIISFTVGSNLVSSWTKANPHNSENAFMQILDSNATMYVWKGKGTDFPTVTQYGYNGGMVGSFVFEF